MNTNVQITDLSWASWLIIPAFRILRQKNHYAFKADLDCRMNLKPVLRDLFKQSHMKEREKGWRRAGEGVAATFLFCDKHQDQVNSQKEEFAWVFSFRRLESMMAEQKHVDESRKLRASHLEPHA